MSKFAERVNTLGTSLSVNKSLIQATFIHGLPKRMQPFAYTTVGGFDELVAAMTHIAESQRPGEYVRQVSEDSHSTNREGAGQAGSPAQMANRFKSMKCYVCKQMGHVSWQKEKWPGEDQSRSQVVKTGYPKAGNGQGSDSNVDRRN